ncbi:MAG: helix-turn-helix domain-containing protein [Paludibacteraceae bacterium]|nr:helix-turn-helix domain-containing protein [Paludibacteraceae bacterium]
MDVKKAREYLNVTQHELAELCGVTLRTIQNWESGKPIPKNKVKLLQTLIESNNKQPMNVYMPSIVDQEKENLYNTLKTQQELAAKMIDELSQFRQMIQKKDEHIEKLLAIITNKENKA